MTKSTNAYAERVRELEAEGMTTSGAQAAADAELLPQQSRFDTIEGVTPPRPKKRRTALAANPQFTIAGGARKQRRPKSKADIVRAAFLKDPAQRPSIVAKATGVDPAYVWDIREAMRRKDLIPRVDPKGGK